MMRFFRFQYEISLIPNGEIQAINRNSEKTRWRYVFTETKIYLLLLFKKNTYSQKTTN